VRHLAADMAVDAARPGVLLNPAFDPILLCQRVVALIIGLLLGYAWFELFVISEIYGRKTREQYSANVSDIVLEQQSEIEWDRYHKIQIDEKMRDIFAYYIRLIHGERTRNKPGGGN